MRTVLCLLLLPAICLATTGSATRPDSPTSTDAHRPSVTVTHSPACDCGPGCDCGCQEGYPCKCGTGAREAPVRRAVPWIFSGADKPCPPSQVACGPAAARRLSVGVYLGAGYAPTYAPAAYYAPAAPTMTWGAPVVIYPPGFSAAYPPPTLIDVQMGRQYGMPQQQFNYYAPQQQQYQPQQQYYPQQQQYYPQQPAYQPQQPAYQPQQQYRQGTPCPTCPGGVCPT